MMRLVYYFIVLIRNILYRFSILKSYHTKTKLISVGNISAGGAGKTPFIIFLLEKLKTDKLVVLQKSYKAQIKGPYMVSNDDTVVLVGDEPLMLKNKFKKLRVCIAKNKTEGALFIDETFEGLDYILVDDAFQHLRLKRDLDIVLVNANRNIFTDKLLPVGHLREPLSSLKRADVIVLTKTNFLREKRLEYMINRLKEYTDKIFVAKSKLILKEKPDSAVLLTAIEDSDFLKKLLIAEGISLKKSIVYPDHYKFTEKDIKEALNFKLPVLTTSKDFVKLGAFKDEFIEFDYKHEVENCQELISYITH